VTIEHAFCELLGQLRELDEALEALGRTADEDKPMQDDVVIASILSDAVLAERGFLEEARQAAEEAYRAALDPGNAARTRGALICCQKEFHRFAGHFASELGSCDRIEDLRTLGKERAQGWLNWTTVVTQTLEQCRELVEKVQNALFLCWQELTESMSMPAVLVQTFTIGQHISGGELIGEKPKQSGVA
jgi:hypothetical protein